jgi:predicted kinase
MWMLVGVPGSGKSTWIGNRFGGTSDAEDIFIASTDLILESIAIFAGKTYNEVFKDHIKTAEKQMYQGLSKATEDGQDIIWDQTNLTRKSRAKKLIMIPDHYEKIAVFFPTPEDLWERLIHRELADGKSIPDHVVRSMIDTMEKPELNEGFDKTIEIIGEYEKHLEKL